MARKSKAEKLAEKEVDRCMRVHLNNVQVDIMDLGKISSAGHMAAINGKSIEDAIKEAITKLRKN